MSLLVTVVLVFSYERSLGLARDIEHARAMALLVLTVASATLTAGLSGLAARLITAATLGSAVLLIQVPWLAGLLHLRPLHLDDWAIASAGGFLATALSKLIQPKD